MHGTGQRGLGRQDPKGTPWTSKSEVLVSGRRRSMTWQQYSVGPVVPDGWGEGEDALSDAARIPAGVLAPRHSRSSWPLRVSLTDWRSGSKPFGPRTGKARRPRPRRPSSSPPAPGRSNATTAGRGEPDRVHGRSGVWELALGGAGTRRVRPTAPPCGSSATHSRPRSVPLRIKINGSASMAVPLVPKAEDGEPGRGRRHVQPEGLAGEHADPVGEPFDGPRRSRRGHGPARKGVFGPHVEALAVAIAWNRRLPAPRPALCS